MITLFRRNKMKAKIYYQDFMLNAGIFKNEDVKLDVDNATYIVTLRFDVETKEEFADSTFREMNIGHILEDTHIKLNFNKAGHTSMSVGDYIKFEDGTIWITAPSGWNFTKVKK
jgi:hypothetical protein